MIPAFRFLEKQIPGGSTCPIARHLENLAEFTTCSSRVPEVSKYFLEEAKSGMEGVDFCCRCFHLHSTMEGDPVIVNDNGKLRVSYGS